MLLDAISDTLAMCCDDSFRNESLANMRILWVSEVDPDPNSGAGGTELLMVQHLRALGHFVETVWATDLPRRIRHGNLHYAFELPRTYAAAIEKSCRGSAFDIVNINLFD